MSAGGLGPPTMRDVARSAGVSLKTVSRVVNGETTVAPDLAARVHAAVESLHYRRHIGAAMLRRNDRRTRTIGLLLQDVANPFCAAVHRAVEDEARQHGVHVLTGSLDDDPQRERDLARAFAQRQVDGLILAPTGSDQAYLASIADLPIVVMDQPADGFAGDSVLATNAEGAAEAITHLIAHGHRRIAYLGDHLRIWTTRSRYQGYLDAVTSAGLTPLDAHELHDPAAAEAATTALLARRHGPTAFFCGQHLITVGAIRALRRAGRHHDVALVGFDDFPLADLLEPAITVVAQDPVAMGRTAARALFERIDGMHGPARDFRIPTTLIPRGSGEMPPGAPRTVTGTPAARPTSDIVTARRPPPATGQA
jgi:LacI family transcriptional regulator, galactose operon repressor